MVEKIKRCDVGGGVIIFFILLFCFAKWGPAINFNTVTQSTGQPFVVSGEGKVFVTPDIAKITIGVEEQGATLKQVQGVVNTKSKALTDSLKKIGIDEKDIKTTSYSVYPQYDYSTPTQKLTGFQISTNYEVTIKNFDKVNDTIISATNAGANVIGGINFEVNDKTLKEKTDEARKLAVEEAKEKAEGLAKSAGMSLGKIINISENQMGNEIRPMYAIDASIGSAGKGVPAPDIQPGQTEINITVSISYQVK